MESVKFEPFTSKNACYPADIVEFGQRNLADIMQSVVSLPAVDTVATQI
jgi:hypothetical protein